MINIIPSLNGIRRIIQTNKIFVVMVVFIAAIKLLSVAFPSQDTLDPTGGIEQINEQELLRIIQNDPKALGVVGTTMSIYGLCFITGILIIFVFAISIFKKKNLLPKMFEPSAALWSIGDIVRAIIVYIFWGYFITLTEIWILGSIGFGHVLKQEWLNVLNAALADVILVGYIICLVKRRFGQNAGSLGLTGTGRGRSIFTGISAYIGFIPIMILTILLSYAAMTYLGQEIESHPLVPMLIREQSIGVLIFLVIMGCLVGPVCEEIFFRGFAYPVLKKTMGLWRGMLIVSALFALIHGNVYAFFPILTLGFLLVYLYEKTGTLTASITVHIIHNSSMMAGVGIYKYLFELTQK